MKINSLDVRHLHGHYHLHLEFFPEVTILAGINGSFKSTILHLLRDITRMQFPTVDVKRIQINYKDDLKAYYYVKSDMRHEYEGRHIQQLTRYQGAAYLTKEEFATHVQLDEVETFDTPLPTLDPTNRKVSSTPIPTFSLLDLEVQRLARDFKDYCTRIFQTITEKLKNQKQVSLEEVEDFYHKKEAFLERINTFFADTHKRCDPKLMEIAFVSEAGTPLPLTQLSSGEKQLLILLLTVFLQEESESVVLLDEPEISLHVRWQYELLEVLTQLNPNAQFILTTHSPSIVSKGWKDHIVHVEDVIRRNDD